MAASGLKSCQADGSSDATVGMGLAGSLARHSSELPTSRPVVFCQRWLRRPATLSHYGAAPGFACLPCRSPRSGLPFILSTPYSKEVPTGVLEVVTALTGRAAGVQYQ